MKKLVIVFLLILTSLLAVNNAIAQVVSSTPKVLPPSKPEAFVDISSVWKGPISVCWANPQGFQKEIGWVETAVREHLQGFQKPVSGLQFFGGSGVMRWPTCQTTVTGIRIRIADERPRSNVGRQLLRDHTGDPLRPLRESMPTEMTLNFEFIKSFDFCAPNKEHCIKAIAVHEFLHAVGFLHEQLRDDAPQQCKDRFKKDVDFKGFKPLIVGGYDSDSHVNYCTDMYRVPIALSKGDKCALQTFYPLVATQDRDRKPDCVP